MWLTVLRDGHPLDLARRAARRGSGTASRSATTASAPRRSVCRNACRFCFVDQVPAGLRAVALREGRRLPARVPGRQLHHAQQPRATPTWRASRTCACRRCTSRCTPGTTRRACASWGARPAAREPLSSGSPRAGLELHLQVVLCPGWNDGDVLAETIAGAGRLRGGARRRHRAGLAGRRGRPAARDASPTPRPCSRPWRAWQARFAPRARHRLRARRRRVLPALRPHAAAERRARAVRERHRHVAPLCSRRRASWRGAALARASGERPAAARLSRRRSRLLTGTLARAGRRARSPACSRRAAACRCGRSPWRNRLFGPHVTVTGLLGGREVLDALRGEPLAAGEWLLAPRAFLPGDLAARWTTSARTSWRPPAAAAWSSPASLREAFATLSR